MAKKKKETLTRAGTARKHGLQYLGLGGFHITGVPARNLDPAEVGELTLKQIDICLDSGLYIANVQEESE